ncbi:glycerol-3-phosphate 1-O-acyltransferase PlsY [Chloroflexota bacterium]|nr:glycerol-3-phosphate 1-O-acyltransferase PlsY [Chloroflexota bacterium]
MNQTLLLIISVIVAYLIGSIPFGYLAAKWRGINIREVGSGNIGATNIARNLGWKLGAVVGVLDFMKSFVPVLIAQLLFDGIGDILLVSIMPIVGHIFPIWLNFRGGKGVASIFGLLGAYFGLPTFLGFLLAWFLVVKQVRLMSLVNLIVALLIPVVFWLKYAQLAFILFGVLLGGIIWITHRANIKRLLAGEENKITL